MRARNLIAAVLCACVGVFVFAGSAMAANGEAPAPETPDIAKAEPVGARSATLHGVLSPGAPGEAGAFYFFVYTTGNECEGPGVDTTARQVSDGAMGEAVQAEVSGLSPDTTYTYCVISLNSEGEGFRFSAPEIFRTSSGPPIVEGQESTSIGSSEATLSAVVSPGGLPTSIRVEYGPTASYGSSTTGRELAGSGVSVSEQVRLQGLTPGSQYHYRFVASNSKGTSEGADTIFATTQAPSVAAFALPDDRHYELVSPPEDTEIYVPSYKEVLGEGAGSETAGPAGKYRASVSGDAVAYVGDPPASGVSGTGITGQGVGNQYLGTRTAGGWDSEDIEPTANALQYVEFNSFSDDLSLLSFQTALPLSASPSLSATCTSHQTAYSRDANGFHALVTESQEGNCEALAGGGISANDSHVLLYGPSVFTPQAKPGITNGSVGFQEDNLYDSVGGKLYQVNVLPDGVAEQHPNATFGGIERNSEGNRENNFLGDVSSDGSRIFWRDLNTEVTPEDPAGTTRLFARENDTQPQSPLGPTGECTVPADACTVQLDAKQGGAGVSGSGVFAAASSDGERVIFTNSSPLTADSKATAGQPDLYEYDLSTRSLSDLTATKAGVTADVLGVIGASEDGSYVYFVAAGILTDGPNAEGKAPVEGQSNLYLVHQGTTTFIATLAVGDNGFPSNGLPHNSGTSGDWFYEPGERDAQVSANGQAVGFMSRLQLTGYDNYGVTQVENGGKRVYADLPEVFVYEAGAARISCVSCNPDGAPPAPSSASWEDEFNSYVPVSGEVHGTESSADFMPRWINSSGTQVYFMSNQSLVASDTNRYQDVYEWQTEGSGGCGQSDGCIAPLSSVTAAGAAYFVDASANGDDVFFTQRASLVPRATDESVKLYDARVDGGFPESSLACTGTGCQGVPPAPPIFATPSSVTFAGVGDFEAPPPTKQATPKRTSASQRRAVELAKALKLCRRKPKKTRGVCERKARDKYAPTKKRGKR